MSRNARFNVDLSSRLILGLILLGLASVLSVAATDSVIAASYSDAVQEIVGAIIFIVMWLYYVTLKVIVTRDAVEVRRFGRSIWLSARGDVQAHIGRAGEMKTHTALVLSAPNKPQIELLRTLFGRQRIAELASLLNVDEGVPDTIF